MNLKTFLIAHKILQVCLTEVSTAGHPFNCRIQSLVLTLRESLHYTSWGAERIHSELKGLQKKKKANKDQQLQGSHVYDWPIKNRACSANIWKPQASRVNMSFLELWDLEHWGNEDLLNHRKICFGPRNSVGSSHTEKNQHYFKSNWSHMGKITNVNF